MAATKRFNFYFDKSLSGKSMARFYGQNNEILHQRRVHTSMLCAVRGTRCNVVQGKDVQ